MLKFYTGYAFKSIARNKTSSILNIAGLAIGMYVFLLALEYYSYEKGFNYFNTNISDIYRVTVATPQSKSGTTVAPVAAVMEKNIPGVRKGIRFADNFNDGAVLSYTPNGNTAGIKSFAQQGCVFVDASFLDAFSFTMLAGNSQLNNPGTMVITAATAKKFFNNAADAVGKTLQLHNQFGNLQLTVTGVLNDVTTQSDVQFTCLLPINILQDKAYTEGSDWAKLDNWGNDSYTSFVWLNRGANPASIALAATALWRKNDPDYTPAKGIVQLQPLAAMHMGANLKDDSPVYASMAMTYFILALGILVLCIAWINYINFSTAYAVSQAKQIGIHKIVGSSKIQIVTRYIIEAVLLNFGALAMALFLTVNVQTLFNYVTAKPLSLQYINHPSTWLYGFFVLVTGIFLCGGYVGLILSKFKPVAIMRFNNTGNNGNVLLRKGLVIFQFVISGVFISATLVAYMQISFLRNHDLGMNINSLVVIDGPAVRETTFKTNKVTFKNEVERLPFVEKISLTGSVPGKGFAHNFGADGITGSNARKGDERKTYFVSQVDENYISTYQLKLQYGNNFTSADADRGFNGDRLMVNETAARQLGYKPAEAAGKTLNWGKPYVIQGVIKDYNHRSLKEKIEPIIYIPQHSNACYTIKTNLSNLSQKMAQVQAIYERLYPGNPFNYTVLKDTYDSLYADEQRAGTVALSLSVLVVIIACLGLVGLSVFTAKRRLKEMGIRKILGAGIYTLFMQLSREFLWLVFAAFIIAMPLAWMAMHKWLENFAYQVTIKWWVFAVSGVAIMVIALLTVSVQALKTAFINPVKTLRAE